MNYCSRCKQDYDYHPMLHDCVVQRGSQPAPDAMLTAEERAYLQESLGLPEPIPSDLDDSTAPYCHSCIKHGDDRVSYPCARALDSCGWRKKQEAIARMSPAYGFSSIGTSTGYTINSSSSGSMWIRPA